MNGWLVDTHALLWFWSDPSRLSESALEVLEADDTNLVVSVATLWEISIKRSLGKLTVPGTYPSMLDDDFALLPIAPAHAHAVAQLPVDGHRDPFDRMLIAQAKVEMLPIISADQRFDEYAVARFW